MRPRFRKIKHWGLRHKKLVLLTWGALSLLLIAGVITLLFIGKNEISNRDSQISGLQQNNDDLQSQVDDLKNQNDDLQNQVDDLQGQVDDLTSQLADSSSTSSISVPTISQTCGNPFPSDITKYVPLTQQQKATYDACVKGWYSKYLPGTPPNPDLLFSL